MPVYLNLTTIRGNTIYVSLDHVSFIKTPDDGSVGTLIGLHSGHDMLVTQSFAEIARHFTVID